MNAASLDIMATRASAASGGLTAKTFERISRFDAARRAYRWVNGRRFVQAGTRFDLFHAISFVTPYETSAPVLPLIHDVSFERLPDTHPAERVAWLRRRLAGINRFAFINTPSEFTADEVAEVYGYPRERIGVTHPGVSERLYEAPDQAALEEVAALGLKDRSFFLTVGTVEPRKNHKVLVEAYAAMPPNVRQRTPLVIVGATGWGSLDAAGRDELVREGSVRFLGYAREELVHALYSTATALLFPTLYEGFGIPVAEAMACGLQPIVSDIPVMHEVAGDAGFYVDPEDAGAWADLLREPAESNERFSSPEQLIARSRLFTWRQNAQKTAALYRRFE